MSDTPLYKVSLALYRNNDGQLSGHEHIEIHSGELDLSDAQDYVFNASKTYSDHTITIVRITLVNPDILGGVFEDLSSDHGGLYN